MFHIPQIFTSSVRPESPFECMASSSIHAATPERPLFITSIASSGISSP